MHGMNGDSHWFNNMQGFIREIDPNVTMYSFDVAEGKASLEINMWDQAYQVIGQIRREVQANPLVYQNGAALICHSQGALLCRCVVELMDDHNIHTLIALVGPQNGEYGIPDGIQEKLPVARSLVWKIAYNSVMQSRLSVANYWHDPRSDKWPLDALTKYLEGNTFLPVLNNDPGRKTQGPGLPVNLTEGAKYKANLLRLKNAIFTCSISDDQIIPFASGIFGFYGDEVDKGIVPIQQQNMWTEDWIGLRNLSETGRLVLVNLPNVCHNCWAQDRPIFDQVIRDQLPHLYPVSKKTLSRDEGAQGAPVLLMLSMVGILVLSAFTCYCLLFRGSKRNAGKLVGTAEEDSDDDVALINGRSSA